MISNIILKLPSIILFNIIFRDLKKIRNQKTKMFALKKIGMQEREKKNKQENTKLKS